MVGEDCQLEAVLALSALLSSHACFVTETRSSLQGASAPGQRCRKPRVRMPIVYDRGFSCATLDQPVDPRRTQSKAHLLLLPQRQQTDTRHLYDLESHTGNITLRLALSSETRDEDLYVDDIIIMAFSARQ